MGTPLPVVEQHIEDFLRVCPERFAKRVRRESLRCGLPSRQAQRLPRRSQKE